MLLLGDSAKAPSLGSFYFSPVRLRLMYDSSYLQPRVKHETKLDRLGELDVEDDSPFAKHVEEINEGATKNHNKIKKIIHKPKYSFEKICSKLRLTSLLIILAVIIAIACCCALYLRWRFVHLFKRIWPFGKKKEPKKNLFDVEEGFPYQNKKSKSSRKKTKVVDSATQDSKTSVGKKGCSPCSPGCKKKKRGKKRKK